MDGLVDGMRVERLADDTAVLGRDGSEPSQQSPPARPRPEQPEVLTEEDERVERPERPVDRVEREHTRVSYTTPATGLDRAAGGVDPDHVEAALLEVEADATSAAPHVQHAPAHEPHRPFFERVVPA